MSVRGSTSTLTVVGIGLRGVHQVTEEVRRELAVADVILAIVEDGESLEWVIDTSPQAEVERLAMVRWWEAERVDEWIDRILAPAAAGERTVLVLEGHPGVCVPPTHLLMRSARDRAIPARMLPAVSTFDALCADLGIDLVSDGCVMFDATSFVRTRPVIDPSSHLVLWQVGVIGDPVQSKASVNQEGMAELGRRLEEFYPGDHEVTLYQQSSNGALISTKRISDLGSAGVSERTTLLVPGTGRPGLVLGAP